MTQAAQEAVFSELAAAGRPRRTAILGSTGSIGTSTLDLIAREPDLFQVEALTANSNVERLAEQARTFRPRLAAIGDPGRYGELKAALSGTGVEAAAGPEAIVEAASGTADWVMAAIVGAAGLPSTLAAIRRGAVVAFANKECLVSAGTLMMGEVRQHGATLLPVDSEHNAIFQVFDVACRDTIERIILTASGGPFREAALEAMAAATPADAVAHPNWSMGAKISVDSATMMNKGLEIIEARHLFAMENDRIDVLVHPQSVIHSMVEYVDGSVLAQLGCPDMRTPIAHTLGWPSRCRFPDRRLDFAAMGALTFEAPDPVRFPALRLARECLLAGGDAPTILNAANEVAVAGFLAGKIGFLEIAESVEAVLDGTERRSLADLDAVFEADRRGRRLADEEIARRAAR